MKFGAHPLTLRQLQYVVAVSEESSFRRAAERCLVSQPSLSAQIAEIEQALGVQLFERNRRRVLVTGAGQEVVGRARAVLLAVEDLTTAAQRYKNPLDGLLRVGVIPTIAPYFLPDLDPALRAAFPGLELHWVEDRTEALVSQLERGVLDAALVALEADLGGLEHELVGEDSFVFAGAKGQAIARKRGSLGLAELGGLDVLLLDDGHCFRDQALDLCAAAGATELGFRATSLTTLVQMVAGRGGVTILPRLAVAVENRREALTIRSFKRPAPKRTLVFAWRPGSPISGALRELARVAQAAYRRTMNAG